MLSPQRTGRLTGSRVGAALGVNPWMTPDQLLRLMVREYHGAEPEFTGNIATEYGTLHEPIARAKLHEILLEMGDTLPTEAEFLISRQHHWLGCTPDGVGISNHWDKYVVEIKCPFGLRHDKEPVFKTLEEQPHYYAQVQVEILCAGADMAYFFQWTEHGHKLEVVRPSFAWLEVSIPKMYAFYQRYASELDNKAHLEPLRQVLQSKDAAVLLAQYEEAKKAIEEATKAKDAALAALVVLAGGKDAEINGVKLTQVERAGTISYAKAIKELLPDADLSKWQGKSTTYWRLS